MLVRLLFCSKYVGSVVVLFEVCWQCCCFVRIMLTVLLFCSKYVGSDVVLFEVCW